MVYCIVLYDLVAVVIMMWMLIFSCSFQTLNRTESMVSLCFRSLTGFVLDDNLQGLQAFLENKQVQVDDRDEV